MAAPDSPRSPPSPFRIFVFELMFPSTKFPSLTSSKSGRVDYFGCCHLITFWLGQHLNLALKFNFSQQIYSPFWILLFKWLKLQWFDHAVFHDLLGQAVGLNFQHVQRSSSLTFTYFWREHSNASRWQVPERKCLLVERISFPSASGMWYDGIVWSESNYWLMTLRCSSARQVL